MSKHKSHQRSIPGDIGYRTRDGRTGLDPMDSRQELASLEGHFIRRLFTGRLRTRNRFYLVGMAMAAVTLLTVPLLGILSQVGMTGQVDGLQVLCAGSCLWPAGIAFLYNTVRSLSLRHRA